MDIVTADGQMNVKVRVPALAQAYALVYVVLVVVLKLHTILGVIAREVVIQGTVDQERQQIARQQVHVVALVLFVVHRVLSQLKN